MTTTNPPILRNCALMAPVGVLCGALWGWDHAVGATVATAVVLGNLWVLSVLGPQVIRSVTRQESVGLWAAALGAKFVVMAALLLGLVRMFPPMGVAMGFVPLMLGTLVTGIQLAREEAAREALDPTPAEEA